MVQLKNSRLLIFIIIGSVLTTIAFLYFVQFNVPEDEVPSPRRISPVVPEIPIAPPIIPPTVPPPLTAPAETVKFTIKGDEFSFFPVAIRVKRGSKVELTFENIGRAPHNYTIDELNVATKTIAGGKSDVISFTAPPTAGTITYASYCSVPGHREAGMEGTIVIE